MLLGIFVIYPIFVVIYFSFTEPTSTAARLIGLRTSKPVRGLDVLLARRIRLFLLVTLISS